MSSDWQGFWETPRNLVIILGAFAVLVATVAGLAGYKFAQQSAVTVQLPPGTVIAVPPLQDPSDASASRSRSR